MKKQSYIFLSYAILILLYFILSLALPASSGYFHDFHLATLQYRVITFTVVLPLAAIWFAAFYADAKMHEYTDLVDGSREGPAYRKMARGIRFMAWGLAVPAILTLLLNTIAVHNHGFEGSAVIISMYLNLLFPLVAFSLIGDGARFLTDITKSRPTHSGTRIMMFLFIILGVLYTYLILHNRHLHANPYHLSIWPLMFTIIIPGLYIWFSGLLATYEILLFSKKVRGLLYQRAMTFLAVGIAIAILSSVLIQYASTVYAYGVHTLNSLLVMIYSLLVFEAVGYILIAVGAKRLKRIEEI